MRASTDRRRRQVITIVFLMVACAVIAWAGSTQLQQGPRTLQIDVAETASIVQSRTTIGFADSELYFLSPTDVNKTLDMMQSAGVNTIRIMIPWAGVERTQGTYSWAAVDTIVNAANARGMAVLGMVNSTPQWAAKPGTPALSGPPASPGVYAGFVSRVATRYKGKISAYEVWNEQNATVFWSTGPDPAGYTQLLKAAYPAIKAADPNATVLVGGLSPLPHVQGSMNPVDYLKGMYANGAKGYFDAVAYHPYGYPATFSQSYYTKDGALNLLIKMRQVMINNGDSLKKIWATEYGLPTGPGLATEAQQASHINNMLTKWRQITYLGPAFIYTTRDSVFNSDTFGVWRKDWTAKAAVAVILKFTGGPIQTMALALMAGPDPVAVRTGMAGVQTVLGAAAAMTSWAVNATVATVQAIAESVLQGIQRAVAVMNVRTESSSQQLVTSSAPQQSVDLHPTPMSLSDETESTTADEPATDPDAGQSDSRDGESAAEDSTNGDDNVSSGRDEEVDDEVPTSPTPGTEDTPSDGDDVTKPDTGDDDSDDESDTDTDNESGGEAQ